MHAKDYHTSTKPFGGVNSSHRDKSVTRDRCDTKQIDEASFEIKASS